MIKLLPSLLLTVLMASSALAQEMPAPRSMPRTPVNREALSGHADSSIPASREVSGNATVIEGDKLKIGAYNLRLFGIVPPLLSASYGPQARAELDALAGGQPIYCKIRDRDRDGRLLATCQNASGADMALGLLRRGLAVTARGSIASTELAAPYSLAEQTAQAQKLGLWAITVTSPPPAAAVPVPKAEASADAESKDAKKEDAKKEEPKKEEAKKDEKKEEKAAEAAPAPSSVQAEASKIMAQVAQDQIDAAVWPEDTRAGFFERYQILISAFLLLGAIATGAGTWLWQRREDKREELRALAAALRGELMAARGVFLGRARSITTDTEDRAAIWPRTRSTLYQAYVGHLGLLRAELARQIASIYGQASDFTALYGSTAATNVDVTKKHAMETLIKHIDEVLPRLAEIEMSGEVMPGRKIRTVMRDAVAPRLQRLMGTRPAPSVAAQPKEAEAPAAVRATIALWDTVSQFIHNHRSATQPDAQASVDPQVADYAAMIEADMEQYQYEQDGKPEALIQKKNHAN